jgi:hypothetical protein
MRGLLACANVEFDAKSCTSIDDGRNYRPTDGLISVHSPLEFS